MGARKISSTQKAATAAFFSHAIVKRHKLENCLILQVKLLKLFAFNRFPDGCAGSASRHLSGPETIPSSSP
jgi:hypothetical protein